MGLTDWVGQQLGKWHNRDALSASDNTNEQRVERRVYTHRHSPKTNQEHIGTMSGVACRVKSSPSSADPPPLLYGIQRDGGHRPSSLRGGGM